MKTPIVDFVRQYAAASPARFHMPGHKGVGELGCEALDLTEIEGADDLSAPCGIIAESEANAATLFGTAQTLYSTAGSTLSIKAMLALAAARAPRGVRPRVLAGRNVHKSFLFAAALLDLDVDYLYGRESDHLCSCRLDPKALEDALSRTAYCAVFITSPDYLGITQDVATLSRICHAHNTPLLVDNAHGAYLAFTRPVRHPMALGADLCADSAHKTLPVLTGGGYLHISKNAPDEFKKGARSAMALFASTSPSYLVLQSLDLCNRTLADGFEKEIEKTAERVEKLRSSLCVAGYATIGNEPLKLTLDARERGYTGREIAAALREGGVEVEFADDALCVLMATPANSEADFSKATAVLLALPPRKKIEITHTVKPLIPERCCSVREAILSPFTRIPVSCAVGRICATPTVSCPPAVPIVASGERIPKEALPLFAAFGIEEIEVLL